MELQEEKPQQEQHIPSDHLAQAVLAQSQALTALVSQIAQTSPEVLRAGLALERACGAKGHFLHSSACCHGQTNTAHGISGGQPSGALGQVHLRQPVPREVWSSARVRELGCLQQQAMSILDCLQASNFQAARNQTALLAVAIDQAALDQGRFELSHLEQCSATGR